MMCICVAVLISNQVLLIAGRHIILLAAYNSTVYTHVYLYIEHHMITMGSFLSKTIGDYLSTLWYAYYEWNQRYNLACWMGILIVILNRRCKIKCCPHDFILNTLFGVDTTIVFETSRQPNVLKTWNSHVTIKRETVLMLENNGLYSSLKYTLLLLQWVGGVSSKERGWKSVSRVSLRVRSHVHFRVHIFRLSRRV